MKLPIFRRLAFLFVVLLLPISVSAVRMSSITNFFSRSLDGEIVSTNSSVQHMALLTSNLSPLGTENNKQHEPLVEENALVPDLSPFANFGEGSVLKPINDQISVYVVREGDTLSQIAKMFDVTVNTIKWSNDISSNTVRSGDTLVILPVSGVKHTVVKGDSLVTIAKKYKGDIEEIASYNNINKDTVLSLGTVVIVPDGEVASVSSTIVYSSNSSGQKVDSGYFTRPIVGGKKTQGIHGYNGIDIGAPLGTPIVAAASGDVIISKSSGWNGGYGSYIVIKHPNGTQTLYAHNSENIVSAGEKVVQGQTIGYVGSTGKSTGAHLHFEVRGAKNPF